MVEAHLFHVLSEMGYDCHTVSYKLLYPSIFFPGTTQYDKSSIVPFEHNDRIEFIINSVNPLTWFKAAKRIKQLKADGVLFVWWMPFFGPALSTIARILHKAGIRIFFLVENYVSHEQRWFDHYATRQTLKYADAFISESQYITKQLNEAFPAKPLYQATLSVYDYYDLGHYTQETAKAHLGIKTKKTVLFFGLIRPYKGLAKLIIAFKELLKTQPDTTLLIAGECYEDEKKYHDLIAQNGLEDKTVFINRFVPNEEVEPYLKAADVVCLPYDSGTQSGVLMMAYGFKKPVVVTDVGGIAELVQDGKTGKVIPNNSTENLVHGLSAVLNNTMEDYAQNINEMIHGLGYKKLHEFIDKNLNK